MKRVALILFTLLFMIGCQNIPFKKTPEGSYSSVDPSAVRERFQAGIPARFRLLNTIVFEYNLKTFSGIGFIDVDTAEKTCALVCINQMGLKLFELSIDRDSVNTLFALPEFTAKGDFGKMVGEDLKRTYFGLVPSKEAEVERNKYSLVFRQQEGEGTAEYVFSGPEQYLTEKTYFKMGAPVWRVSFYEYKNRDGKIYPGGTILNNYLYGYRLIIRLKEISD